MPFCGGCPLADDPTRLRASEIARRVRAGELSAVAVAEAHLARAGKVGPPLNTWITLDREGALKAAKDVDAAASAGKDPGPLAGVPVGLKDIIDAAGLPTTAGSLIDKDRVPAGDAPLTRRFRAAGAVILGKLNLHEYAFGPTGHNPHYGDQKNPWDPARVTGGSSGGSGNAVSSGQAPVTVGSDTGGSIRYPSALCGVMGLKTTFGLVGKASCVPCAWSLDTFGPLALTAEDCALAMTAMAGYEPADPCSVNRPAPDFIGALERPLKGFRIGHARSFYADRSEPFITKAVDEAARAFADAGAEVTEIEIPQHEQVFEAAINILMSEVAAFHEMHIRERPGDMDPYVVERMQTGFFVPATAYIQALRFRSQWTGLLLREVYSKVDGLLFATVPMAAPRRDADKVTLLGKEVDARLGLTWFSRLANFSGGPAACFPVGFSPEGLPLGAQLMGAPFDDHRMLAAVHQLEKTGAIRAVRAPFEG